jgi:hypothetical protein
MRSMVPFSEKFVRSKAASIERVTKRSVIMVKVALSAKATRLNLIFKRVCVQHIIKHVHMPADRPELNGKAERWDKTVMLTANSMSLASRLLFISWPSAVAHANF